MNVLKVIEQKTLGGDDLSTHYAGENEPQPGCCHDGPGHGLAVRVLSSKVYAMQCHFQKYEGEWELCKWMRMDVLFRIFMKNGLVKVKIPLCAAGGFPS